MVSHERLSVDALYAAPLRVVGAGAVVGEAKPRRCNCTSCQSRSRAHPSMNAVTSALLHVRIVGAVQHEHLYLMFFASSGLCRRERAVERHDRGERRAAAREFQRRESAEAVARDREARRVHLRTAREEVEPRSRAAQRNSARSWQNARFGARAGCVGRAHALPYTSATSTT